MHGFRVQAMFAYVAAALGHCKLITEEDSGIFFDGVGDLRRPDFRVLIRDGSQFLVEVKSFREKNAWKPYSFKRTYLDKVQMYAVALGIPLKFAIYWSCWNIWTLVDASRLDQSGPKVELPLTEAIKINEMNALGDSMVGTVPPLSIRLHADRSKPRTVSSSGEVPFTIGRVSLHSGSKEIRDENESKIAWFLMLHGKWNELEKTAKIDGNQLDHMELSVTPEESSAEQQGFDLVGNMSQMISIQFLNATSDGNEIRSLAPSIDVNQLGVLIPHDYKGKALHLWRFHQIQPNFDVAAETEISEQDAGGKRE